MNSNEHLKNMQKMYNKLSYYDHYGGTLILFIIITIIVILLILYFQMMINVQPIIDNWAEERCKPHIIPFAGLINRPHNLTAGEYTSENFNYCTQEILKNTTNVALQPLNFITQFLQMVADGIQQSIQSIRAMFDKVRNSMQSVSEEIMGRLMNVMIPLLQMIISFKDLNSKLQGTMTAGLYTLLGGYFTLNSLMGSIAQFIIIILTTLAALIAGLWVLPITWGAAVANTSIFVAIAVPMAIILSFMSKTLKVSGSYKIPSVKCFDKNTTIKMNDGTYKFIMDINVGDILENNNIVTSKIKVTTKESTMYKLNNIIVSDSHVVNYNNEWIKISEHPESQLLGSYNEPYLYCLNTEKKIITINDIIFTDWDEIYGNTLEQLLLRFNTYNHNMIYQYLNCGFVAKTKIEMYNGNSINIEDVKINDILQNGETVYGIVEIDGSIIKNQYKYYLGEAKIIEGYDINLQSYNREIINNHKKLYNILTTSGKFIINNNVINDYNYVIDHFLLFSKIII